MKINTFLRINSKGRIQICKKPPRLAGDEVSVRLVMELPEHLFKRPRLTISPSVFGFPPEIAESDVVATAEFAGSSEEARIVEAVEVSA